MDEIAGLLENLTSFDDTVWPWKFIAPSIAHNATLSFAPPKAGAVWESARFERRDAQGKIVERGEFGRVFASPKLTIGYRAGDTHKWTELTPDEAYQIWVRTASSEWQNLSSQPLMSVTANELVELLDRGDVHAFGDMNLHLAHEAYVEAFWVQHGTDIVKNMLSAKKWNPDVDLPAVGADDELLPTDCPMEQVKRVLPFTAAGFDAYLKKAPQSGLRWSELRRIANAWWGRQLPRDLLATSESLVA